MGAAPQPHPRMISKGLEEQFYEILKKNRAQNLIILIFFEA